MAKAPFAEWRGPLPSTNYSAGPTQKIGVTHHTIVGSLSSADGEFHSPGAQLSAHFGVGSDGHIVQWLDTDDTCYAQMNGNWPPIAYIAIETEGQATDPWTAAQIAALGQIDAWAASVHHFPLALVDHGTPGLTTHAHYPSGAPDPSWGNHSCPGSLRISQMPQVLAAATGAPVATGGDPWWCF